MFGHSIGYWLLDLLFGMDFTGWAMRAIIATTIYGFRPARRFLRRQRDAAERRYWRGKANVRALGEMQRDYMDDQAAIWRRYVGMKHASVAWRREQFDSESRQRRAAHERALAQIRKAVRDE